MGNDNKYDTRIYTDYSSLPEETKKALFAEWLKLHPAESKLQKMCRAFPLIFAVVTALFVIASGIVALVSELTVICIVLLACGVVSLVFCIIFNERSARLGYDQSIRYAAWLKSDKNVIAELKPRKK